MDLVKIIIYSTSTGKEPYSTWEDKLDTKTQAIVKNRLDRIMMGNFGDAKKVKDCDGIWELRINYGPGFRIYFGKQNKTIIVLLIGGDKGSQSRDITKAKRYWLDYKDSI